MKKIITISMIILSLVSCGNGKGKDVFSNISDKFSSANENIKNESRKTGYVIKVYDGDTVTLEDKTRLRLYGIDAPELKQRSGKFARELLYDKIFNKKIEYEVISTDRYGRHVAKIYYKNEYINLYMLQNGGAWWYEEYARNDKDLQNAFDTAKRNRIGIFKDYNIKNPSEYRKEMKRK